jgi:hypothetical protein
VRGRPEITSPFDLLWSPFYGLSVDIFCLCLFVEKLFNIFHLAGESASGGRQKLGVFEEFEPFNEV